MSNEPVNLFVVKNSDHGFDSIVRSALPMRPADVQEKLNQALARWDEIEESEPGSYPEAEELAVSGEGVVYLMAVMFPEAGFEVIQPNAFAILSMP